MKETGPSHLRGSLLLNPAGANQCRAPPAPSPSFNYSSVNQWKHIFRKADQYGEVTQLTEGIVT